MGNSNDFHSMYFLYCKTKNYITLNIIQYIDYHKLLADDIVTQVRRMDKTGYRAALFMGNGWNDIIQNMFK